jgi:hypothetical protein
VMGSGGQKVEVGGVRVALLDGVRTGPAPVPLLQGADLHHPA